MDVIRRKGILVSMTPQHHALALPLGENVSSLHYSKSCATTNPTTDLNLLAEGSRWHLLLTYKLQEFLASHHAMYLHRLLWSFLDATMTWHSTGFTWHSCTCNPEVWESRCLMGGVWTNESWESINKFSSLPPHHCRLCGAERLYISGFYENILWTEQFVRKLAILQ